MIRAVILDMDGTMFDSEAIYIDAYKDAAARLGVADPTVNYGELLGISKEAVERVLAKKYGDAAMAKALNDSVYAYMDEFYANNPPPAKPGLFELLDHLQRGGYKIGMATSSPTNMAEGHLKSAGIFERFDAIVTEEMVERTKPAPDPYLLCARMLDCPVEECLVVEDSSKGAEAALAAGMRTLIVPDVLAPEEGVASRVEAVLGDLHEVRSHLKNLEA